MRAGESGGSELKAWLLLSADTAQLTQHPASQPPSQRDAHLAKSPAEVEAVQTSGSCVTSTRQ